MPPREIREYACPLLQPPINRLFIPRPIPDYVRPQDRDPEERTGTKFNSMASFMDALKTASQEDNPNEELSPKIIKQQKVIYNNYFIFIFLFLFLFLFIFIFIKD